MYYFTDTADDIHPPTPEEDAAYRAENEEIKADCKALLATVRQLLTGLEIDQLEAALSDGDKSIDIFILATLRIQFYAQICNFKDRRANV